MEDSVESGLSFGALALVAVLSIGGLMLLGWQFSVVGNATVDTYSACCTVETWRLSPNGYTQGNAETFTSFCRAYESDAQCCIRDGLSRFEHPIGLIGSKYGACENRVPESSYPVYVPGQSGYGKV